MKAITITKENIGWVYSRLSKFFYNKNRTGFEEWHNFDCGFKKHISRYITIDGEKEEICNYFPSPELIELVEKGNTWIRIVFTPNSIDTLEVGDKIAFLSNRIIIKNKWGITPLGKNIYTVYQVKSMSEEYKSRIRMRDIAETMI